MSNLAPDSRVLPSKDNRLGRDLIGAWVATAPEGYVVTVRPPRRSLSQNDLLHSLWDQLAKAMPEYRGIRMTAEDWKALTIVSFAIADAEADGVPIRLVPDLEGNGMVQLRESSAKMSKARASRLTEYVLKIGAENGVTFKEFPT